MISVGSSAAISVSVRFKLSGLIRIEYEKLIILTKKKKKWFLSANYFKIFDSVGHQHFCGTETELIRYSFKLKKLVYWWEVMTY